MLERVPRFIIKIDEQSGMVYKIPKDEYSKKFLKKEFNNMVKLRRILKNRDIFYLPEKISYNNGVLITSYIRGRRLDEILNLAVLKKFAEKLKKFHGSGLTHGELEIHDVVIYKNKFYIFDLAFLNRENYMFDLASLIVSIFVEGIRKSIYDLNPKVFFRYKKFANLFIKSYDIGKDKNEFIRILKLTISIYSYYIIKELRTYFIKHKLLGDLRHLIKYVIIRSMKRPIVNNMYRDDSS